MTPQLFKEDKLWEAVLEALSEGGRLSQFYKLPKHEVDAIVRVYGKVASVDLARVFALTHGQKFEARNRLLGKLGEYRVYAMLLHLIRGMKCWVESDSPVKQVRAKWRVAHA